MQPIELPHEEIEYGPNEEGAIMNRISLIDLAKKQAMQPLLEKEIQVRAYELYERRGKGQGFAIHDWLAAEAEVLARFSSPLPSSSCTACGLEEHEAA
jgi:Protein of unknown function (DUF2934)